jgi:hypothetical protein
MEAARRNAPIHLAIGNIPVAMGDEQIRRLIERIKRSIDELLETDRRRRTVIRGTPAYHAAAEEQERAAQRVFEVVREAESSRRADSGSDARPLA